MKKLTYESAGVSKEAGYRSVDMIRDLVRSTYSSHVLGDLGGFAGCVEIPPGYKKPVLVSGTDGVGTKLLLAQMTDRHDSVGIDLVAMCVNDVICCGAKPLLFLDYIACGKNDPEKIKMIVKGIAEGCIEAECSLVGGETAEMPGMYGEDEYDLAGFCCAVAEKDEMGFKMSEGDVLIGLKSSGVHSNGFSLLRRLFFEIKNYTPESRLNDLDLTLGEELLKPTNIYAKDIAALTGSVKPGGMCHITGGGFMENIPRMVPDGLCASISVKEIEHPPIFDIIRREADISELELYSTFNMGIGFVIAAAKEDAGRAMEVLKQFPHEPVIIGNVIKNEEKVQLCL